MQRPSTGSCSRDAASPGCKPPAPHHPGGEHSSPGSGDTISPYSVFSPLESSSSPSEAATPARPDDVLLKCYLCQGLFEGSGNFLDHLAQIHPGRTSLCGNPTCPPIKRERDLLRHLETSLVHANRPYLCPCGYARGRKDEFKRHFVKDLATCRGHYKCKCGLMRLSRADFGGHFATCGSRRRGRPRKAS
ncbi:hypothetical protein Micbo1qcDRAFT_167467 [Microdochium bolleyi]|uniref:C2H2-type domain-containing protein n=1 Tax=Microdochium bolleyi TaxID=196109 RepID=A0A136IR99_9PEZI|nr:hypothetical protein Micbo1qcDRAFT_167467 [Microdochium bolleyi]